MFRQYWGPRGFTLDFYEADLRPGGRWRIGMTSPDGRAMINGGTYREIAPPTRLVMTHARENAAGRLGPETLVTITLTERNGATEMLFQQTGFETIAARDGHAGGWGEAFDALGASLNRSRAV